MANRRRVVNRLVVKATLARTLHPTLRKRDKRMRRLLLQVNTNFTKTSGNSTTTLVLGHYPRPPFFRPGTNNGVQRNVLSPPTTRHPRGGRLNGTLLANGLDNVFNINIILSIERSSSVIILLRQAKHNVRVSRSSVKLTTRQHTITMTDVANSSRIVKTRRALRLQQGQTNQRSRTTRRVPLLYRSLASLASSCVTR